MRSMTSEITRQAWQALTPDEMSRTLATLAAMARHADDESAAVPEALVLVSQGHTIQRACALALTRARAARMAEWAEGDAVPMAPEDLPDLPEAPSMATAEDRMNAYAATDERGAAILRALIAHVAEGTVTRCECTVPMAPCDLPRSGARATCHLPTIAAATGAPVRRTYSPATAQRLRMVACDAYAGWSLMLRPFTRRGERRDRKAVAVQAFRYVTRERGTAGSAGWQDGVPFPVVKDGNGEPFAPHTVRKGVPMGPDGTVRPDDVTDVRYGRSRKGRTYRKDRTDWSNVRTVASERVERGGARGIGTVDASTRDRTDAESVRTPSRRMATDERVAEVREGTAPCPVPVHVAGPAEGRVFIVATDGTADVSKPVYRCGCTGRRGLLVLSRPAGTDEPFRPCHVARPRASRRSL